MADTKDYSGWVMFSWLIFFLAGVANLAFGAAALIRAGYFPEGASFLADEIQALGWAWIIGGAIELLLCYGIWSRAGWGRVAGIVWAVIMAVFWFFDMLYLPVIGLAMVIIYVLVIYGLASSPEQFE
jgi:hypothetical protein